MYCTNLPLGEIKFYIFREGVRPSSCFQSVGR